MNDRCLTNDHKTISLLCLSLKSVLVKIGIFISFRNEINVCTTGDVSSLFHATPVLHVVKLFLVVSKQFPRFLQIELMKAIMLYLFQKQQMIQLYVVLVLLEGNILVL